MDCLCHLACILKNVSSIDERERRSSRSFAPDLSNVITKFLSALTASVASIGESGVKRTNK